MKRIRPTFEYLTGWRVSHSFKASLILTIVLDSLTT
uniref:Uncharacterized protein n=1 Tax=Nelumbo nucifera TaxID=4432 RepID=A0A822Z2D6_NELNU|nr:TPA_asm: hypothetical protein HUJ06_006298 [Nelumbo nucifera]